MNEANLPRIAASSYLNTAPLIWSFLEGTQAGNVRLFTHEAPARCAVMLSQNDVDAALVPVIEYQRMDGVQLVPSVCVGSRRRVKSVVMVTRLADLREVRSVALDTSSRTSAALVEIIFKEFIGISPVLQPAHANLRDMLAGADAALIIGDPAMTFPRDGLYVHDMAALWREHTGLGFVFAMWMVRESALEILKQVDFAEARDEGLANAAKIADLYEKDLGLHYEELYAYLTENISFSLNEEMKMGLERYYFLAKKHGIISEVRPLKFCPGPALVDNNADVETRNA
jgi:chorismate dehydratase